jgi:hypothetical protein
MTRTLTARAAAVVALILLQVGIGVWQHFGSTRYFAWAPNDYLMTYDLQVTVNGASLSRDEISRRYRLSLTPLVKSAARTSLGLAPSERYVWQDPPAEVRERIRRVEDRLPASARGQVVLSYQLDAGPRREWRWPR